MTQKIDLTAKDLRDFLKDIDDDLPIVLETHNTLTSYISATEARIISVIPDYKLGAHQRVRYEDSPTAIFAVLIST